MNKSIEAQIDFHEFGLLNHYDVEKILYEFIEDSHVAGYENVLIITGKGQFVRPLVQKLLKSNQLVKSFKSASYYHGGSGAFEVELY